MNTRTTDFASLLWTTGSRIAYKEKSCSYFYISMFEPNGPTQPNPTQPMGGPNPWPSLSDITAYCLLLNVDVVLCWVKWIVDVCADHKATIKCRLSEYISSGPARLKCLVVSCYCRSLCCCYTKTQKPSDCCIHSS